MTIVHNYQEYKDLVDSGIRNIRFESLLDHTVSTDNPITTDTGFGIDCFRGVSGSSVI